jgi:hypothetical protein
LCTFGSLLHSDRIDGEIVAGIADGVNGVRPVLAQRILLCKNIGFVAIFDIGSAI